MKEQSNTMNYQDAMEYIEKVNVYGSVLGLETTKELLRRLGNPQNQLKFIHVAGTNGKGSVCSYLGTILASGGYLVGRYISPTIMEYRERIQLQKNQSSVLISEDEVAGFMDRIKGVIDNMLWDGLPHPTPFEIETAMAFLYFEKKRCDIVILEVGLGGRKDSTNVITTAVCSVITSISMDHMKVLGDTIEKIAWEKAGIIKKGIPVVTCEQKQEAMKVLWEESEKNHSPIYSMSLDEIKNVEYSLKGTVFDYKKDKKLEISLLGENQVENAALAIEAVHVLISLGYSVSDRNIREGLLYTRWPGRFEMIKTKPYIFIDGAHNEDGARSLSKSIEIYFTNRRIIYIMGVLADKDYHSILKHTASFADTIITITPDNPRALSSHKLAKAALSCCDHVIDGETVKKAVDIGLKLARPEDVILVFGSLSFLGDIYRTLELPGYVGIRKDLDE